MATSIRDLQFADLTYRVPEVTHQYGAQVHILNHPLLLSVLAQLCSAETFQPFINEYVSFLYRSLFEYVVNKEFPTSTASIPTRMATAHPNEGVYEGPVLDPSSHVVSVNLARAGTLPSHIFYSLLNLVLDPHKLRQDHISIARQTNFKHEVTGSALSGHKIGGPVDRAILLIPDPMGATGSTLIETLRLYKSYGKAAKTISAHCVITPEFARAVGKEFPEHIIYSIRMDRGLSDSSILKTPLGSQWDQEKGLNAESYIVPGAGGIGEVLNNAFV